MVVGLANRFDALHLRREGVGSLVCSMHALKETVKNILSDYKPSLRSFEGLSSCFEQQRTCPSNDKPSLKATPNAEHAPHGTVQPRSTSLPSRSFLNTDDVDGHEHWELTKAVIPGQLDTMMHDPLRFKEHYAIAPHSPIENNPASLQP